LNEDIEKYIDYIAERGNGMVRCVCGLVVANDKMKIHLRSEHRVKMVSDWLREQSK